jgi:hypothetical protein
MQQSSSCSSSVVLFNMITSHYTYNINTLIIVIKELDRVLNHLKREATSRLTPEEVMLPNLSLVRWGASFVAFAQTSLLHPCHRSSECSPLYDGMYLLLLLLRHLCRILVIDILNGVLTREPLGFLLNPHVAFV